LYAIWYLGHPLTYTENFTEIPPIGRGVKRKRVAKIAILGMLKAISRKWCKIGGKLVLISNRKTYMSFPLVSKSVTLNDLEQCNGPYSVASGAHCQKVIEGVVLKKFGFAISSDEFLVTIG